MVVASLIIAGVITYGVVLVLSKAAGFTLTLPGIAGLIVGVGITADSFIVYFERIRDEMRDGKSMRVAVETGWYRARNTCLAADAVSLLAAVVLYIFAIGVVRGFAFALGISTLIDVAVFFWFTKPMMTLLARYRFFNTGHPVLRPVPRDPRHRRESQARARGGEGLMGKASRLGNALYEGDVSIDFVGRKWLWYSVSAVILAAGHRRAPRQGPELRHRVRGRRRVRRQPSQPTRSPRTNADEIRTAVAGTGIDAASSPIVNTSGTDSIRVQTEELTNDQATEVADVIAETVGVDAKNDISTQEVGASWGAQVAERALLGLGVFMILVVLFIWAYFREWKMSVGAIVALIHDVVITIGVYALSGFEVTPATVTGILTILGFSLYDTVVVFDKVRENTRNLRQSKQTYAQLANLAVNQTLVRSINTSIVALLPVGVILYVGVATLGTGALKDLSLVPVRGHGGRCLLVDLHRDAPGGAPEVTGEGDHRAGRPRQGACPAQRGPLRRRTGVRRRHAGARSGEGVDPDEELEEERTQRAVQAPPRRPEASGSGRVVPGTKAPLGESGAAKRAQPKRQPRSKRGK